MDKNCKTCRSSYTGNFSSVCCDVRLCWYCRRDHNLHYENDACKYWKESKKEK